MYELLVKEVKSYTVNVDIFGLNIYFGVIYENLIYMKITVVIMYGVQ